MEKTAATLYGPNATGQVDPSRFSSFTFTDLLAYNISVSASAAPTSTPGALAVSATATPIVAGEPPEATTTPQTSPPRIQTAIDSASWIVIAMLDTNPAITSTAALHNFLSQSGDALRNKRVIVFAAAAPYYLDATEISRITAYYGVYSRTPTFLEAAIRVLFGEFTPQGDSPVSVPSLGYSLVKQTQPNPDQVIPVVAVSGGSTVTTTLATPAPLEVTVGDKLLLRAGPIVDRNGHIVPDDTPAQFVLKFESENTEQRMPALPTRNGVVETTLEIKREENLEIRVEADPAKSSYKIQVNTAGPVSLVEVISPTPLPTATPQPTAAPTKRPTSGPTIISAPQTPPAPPISRASLIGFVITFLALLGFSSVMFITLSNVRPQPARVPTRLRAALFTWTIGWIAYMAYALGALGMTSLAGALGWIGSPLLAIGVALIVVFAVMLVALLRSRSAPAAS
jgi:beta-N-acetylhexosaminidase